MKRSIIMLKHHNDNSIKQPKLVRKEKKCFLKPLDHHLITKILNYCRLG